MKRDGLADESVQVQMISLDDFVYRDRHSAPDIVKIDMEGAEDLILREMQDLLTHKRPILIVGIHGQAAGSAVFEILTGHHYSLDDVEQHKPILTGEGLVAGHILATPK